MDNYLGLPSSDELADEAAAEAGTWAGLQDDILDWMLYAILWPFFFCYWAQCSSNNETSCCGCCARLWEHMPESVQVRWYRMRAWWTFDPEGAMALMATAPEAVKKDRKFCVEAVKHNENCLHYIGAELKTKKDFMLHAVENNARCLEHANDNWKSDRQIILEAVTKHGDALEHAAVQLKADKEVVLAAIQNKGTSLKFAADGLKSAKEIVLTALKHDVNALQSVNKDADIWSDKDFVLQSVRLHGESLRNASKKLTADKEVVRAAAMECGTSLQYASEDLKKDKSFILEVVKKNGTSLQYAADNLKEDTEIVLAAFNQIDVTVHNRMTLKDLLLAAVAKDGTSLKYAVDSMKKDRDVVFAAFKQMGVIVDDGMTTSKELVLAAVAHNGDYLQYACENLRSDKELVRQAVRNKPSSLKFAMGGLNQNDEFLKESGLWDMEQVAYSRAEKAILSVKFSLGEKSTPYATEFALAMKQDSYLQHFRTYNPNAWNKKSCDPSFTDITHPCRGAQDTCSIAADQNLGADNRPTKKSCWRFAFRFQQEECKSTNGFMIQVEEKDGLGAGQEIETEMAKLVGLKVFRTREKDLIHLYHGSFFKVGKAVKDWYASGCANSELEIIDM